MKSVAIIDYGMGNLFSIYQAVRKAGAHPTITHDSKVVLESDFCILPGVGAFAKGITRLKELSLDDILHEYVVSGKYLLGICLGMQLLVDHSEEMGHYEGLSLIGGYVEKIRPSSDFKIPHIGWNQILVPERSSSKWQHPIFNEVQNRAEVYFVHSYGVQVKNPANVLAITNYGQYQFCSAIFENNVVGCQFHPEKSSVTGLMILKNFISM